jgi:lipid-binding SYLF domain-containing protein
MNRFTLPLVGCLIVSGPAWAGGPELAVVKSATEVVRSFSALPVASIPPAMLRDAAGVAIIPDLVKAGFLVGGRYGRGVVLQRLPDGSWGDPVFVTLAGGGFGLQAGIQSADVILVFKTAKSLDRVLLGKGKVTLGGDIGIAAGPVGRQAEAATDGQLKAEIYSYSRSRGLFAGVSLEGAGIWADAIANRNFYRERGVPHATTTRFPQE